MKIHK